MTDDLDINPVDLEKLRQYVYGPSPTTQSDCSATSQDTHDQRQTSIDAFHSSREKRSRRTKNNKDSHSKAQEQATRMNILRELTRFKSQLETRLKVAWEVNVSKLLEEHPVSYRPWSGGTFGSMAYKKRIDFHTSRLKVKLVESRPVGNAQDLLTELSIRRSYLKEYKNVSVDDELFDSVRDDLARDILLIQGNYEKRSDETVEDYTCRMRHILKKYTDRMTPSHEDSKRPILPRSTLRSNWVGKASDAVGDEFATVIDQRWAKSPS